MTPGTRFYERCKQLNIEFTMYQIACPKHGNVPAVYDPAINGYECRPCMYHHIIDRAGKYHIDNARKA